MNCSGSGKATRDTAPGRIIRASDGLPLGLWACPVCGTPVALDGYWRVVPHEIRRMSDQQSSLRAVREGGSHTAVDLEAE